MSNGSFLWKMGLPMKNGIRSNGNRLVLVSSNGQPVEGQETLDDATVDYKDRFDMETLAQEDGSLNTALLILMVVSIACTTAAIATGSYAVWLSRHSSTQKTLTDVNEILKSCQSRMQQLESEVTHLPEIKLMPERKA